MYSSFRVMRNFFKNIFLLPNFTESNKLYTTIWKSRSLRTFKSKKKYIRPATNT